MNKLMTLIVAVAVATVTQAATFSWELTGAGDYMGKNVYSFNASDRATVIDALTAGGDGIADKIDNLKSGGPAQAAGRSGKEKVNGIGNVADAKDSYSAFFIVFDNAIADGNTYSISDNIDVTANVSQPGSGGKAAYSVAATSVFKTTGQMIGGATPPPGPGGVPEPTSGLLLALGGAALALRRKQK